MKKRVLFTAVIAVLFLWTAAALATPPAKRIGPNTDLEVGSLVIGGANALTEVPTEHDFANATARDAYFDGTPNAAVDDYCHLQDTGFIQRCTVAGSPGTWVNVTALTKGPQGDAGSNGADGADGSDGADGADGEDAFVYIAYASDNSGTGFTTTFNASLAYIAVLATDTEIATPQASDFAGLWTKYKGDDGAGSGDMTKAVYDSNDDGEVDDGAIPDAVARDSEVPSVDNTPDDGGADAAGEDWAYDHAAAVDPHPGYQLESGMSTAVPANETNPGAQVDLDVPSQAEAEAGVATDERVWTAQRIAQAIAALAPGGVDEIVYQADCSGITNGFCIDTDNGYLHYYNHSSVVQLYPIAASSETAQGIIEKATTAESVTGSDTDRAVTPAGLTARLAAPGAIGGTTPATNLVSQLLTLSALSSAPGTPVHGTIYRANGAASGGWDPITYNPTGDVDRDYFVIYNADDTEYVGIIDENGVWLLDEVDLGSGTLIAPYGTNPTTGAAGRLAIDSDDNFVEIYGSATRSIPTEFPIYISVAEPDGMDARDYMPIFTNNTGASITITKIYAISDDDDTDFRIEEYDADGSSNEALVKAETCDTGSGPYTNDGQSTITNATVENGHILVLDFDDTDTPDYLHFTIWYTVGEVD